MEQAAVADTPAAVAALVANPMLAAAAAAAAVAVPDAAAADGAAAAGPKTSWVAGRLQERWACWPGEAPTSELQAPRRADSLMSGIACGYAQGESIGASIPCWQERSIFPAEVASIQRYCEHCWDAWTTHQKGTGDE